MIKNSAKTLMFVALILSACSLSPATDLPRVIESNSLDNECIPPITGFAFPVNSQNTESGIKQKSPPLPWQVEAPIPEGSTGTRLFDWIEFARTKNQHGEIWITRISEFMNENDERVTRLQFLIYHTDTKEWDSIPKSIDGDSAKSGSIYLGKDGTIWAEFAFSKPEIGYFAIYNELTKTFDSVKDSESIPSGNRLLDDNGIFWIIYNGIYSFNPVSGEIKQHISIPNLNSSGSLYSSMATLALDGSIYFANVTGDQEAELLHFSPQTGNVDSESLNNAYYYLGDVAYSLFMDRSGKLWVSDLGWLEPNGTWYRIVRSPIFITDRAESGMKYTWVHPSIVHESSNGLLWFHSENGMAWLNPEKAEWCWFTTEQSNIVEDQEGNLWMLADNKLYRLNLTANVQK